MGAALMLFAFDPGQWGFFPRCPFHALTGWFCPGCGTQRALHALLHADIGAALRHNALFVAALPLVAFLVVREQMADAGRRLVTPFATHRNWLLTLGALTLAFTVLRNTPAFTFLVPPG